MNIKAITMGDGGITKGKEPVEMLKSGQLLSIGGDESAGLIIQKPFFAEFVSHGAAIGGLFDLQCVTVYTLGNVQITVPASKGERQTAFQKRIADIESMQDLCQADSPLERGVAVLQRLCEQFDLYQIETIPNDVLAKLVGVLPSTIASAWTCIKSKSSDDFPSEPSPQVASAV